MHVFGAVKEKSDCLNLKERSIQRIREEVTRSKDASCVTT